MHTFVGPVLVFPAVTVTWMKLSTSGFPDPSGVDDNTAVIPELGQVRFTVALLNVTGFAVVVPVEEARTKVDPNNCIGVCPTVVRLQVKNTRIVAAEKRDSTKHFHELDPLPSKN